MSRSGKRRSLSRRRRQTVAEPGQQPAAEPATTTTGRRLRQAREELGLSLDELARTTKISKATLIALESGDVERLPPPVYTRGFIKAYAHEVGLDPQATVEAYLDGLGSSPSARADVPGVTPEPSVDAAVVDDRAKPLLGVNHSHRFSRVTTIAAIIGLVVYIVSINRDNPDRSVAAAPSGADAQPVRVSTESGAASGQQAVSMKINGPLTVELVPQGPCWIVATVDGERVVARLLQAGERQTLEIKDEALLRVGDPGALSLSINGHSGRVPGAPGQPVDIKITKDNFKDFLSS